MGRHSRPDTTESGPSDQDRPRRIALAVRHTIPAPTPTPAMPPGLDVTTLTIRPVGPTAAVDAGPPPADRVELRLDPAPVPATGPPARLGWRGRRAARHDEAEKAALAARVSRAQRRSRQVAASSTPAPRSADPSSISGPLSISALASARPPWSGVAVPTQRA
ncbi:hypothetical protein [Actinomycetospora aeridis]|uniref:Uncharacterized protein n=1 Tax=Actinomycetospora aeridis TaxID=3129231 RepID=A0ABU8N895_9PSEU